MINTTSILAIADSDGVVGEGTFFTSYFLGEPMTPNTWPACRDGGARKKRDDGASKGRTFVILTARRKSRILFVCLFVPLAALPQQT